MGDGNSFDNNNMASREMLSKILKSTIQTSLKGGQQRHPIRRILAKNSPCIANVVYRKLSTSLTLKDAAHEHGKIDKRTKEEITKYVGEELQKNWVGYGFYSFDRFRDTVAGNMAFFIVAASCWIPIWFYNYMPDYQLRNWATREAYLLLKEREDAGVFPISKDFLDPAKVELPSDEELGDIDIRI